MFSVMCDEVGRGDISHKCCNVDTVKGSVKHIMFGYVRTLRLAITVLWSDKPSTTVGVWMFLQEERVIMMSSQWPCMCVGKFTCLVVSNDARMSLNVVVVADGVSK